MEHTKSNRDMIHKVFIAVKIIELIVGHSSSLFWLDDITVSYHRIRNQPCSCAHFLDPIEIIKITPCIPQMDCSPSCSSCVNSTDNSSFICLNGLAWITLKTYSFVIQLPYLVYTRNDRPKQVGHELTENSTPKNGHSTTLLLCKLAELIERDRNLFYISAYKFLTICWFYS